MPSQIKTEKRRHHQRIFALSVIGRVEEVQLYFTSAPAFDEARVADVQVSNKEVDTHRVSFVLVPKQAGNQPRLSTTTVAYTARARYAASSVCSRLAQHSRVANSICWPLTTFWAVC
jgi:hypothetical protein